VTEASKEAANACRNALYLTDPLVDRENIISAKGARVAGTCEWIIHNKNYTSWLDGGTPLLWISGGPGKGKTMLSVFLTEELARTTLNVKNAQLAFYFCSYQDEKRNTAVAILRGLVHQIITKRPALVKHALPYFETHERTVQTLTSLETLWIIFTRLIGDLDLGIMFCVLDGLDECEEDGLRVLIPRLVSLLTPKTASTTTAFRLAIVSRDLPGLQGCARIKLDPDNNEHVSDDIERFISSHVDELSRIEGFNNNVRVSVQTALLTRAQGTFLWVGFAMHELLQKRTCTQVLEALDVLPSGLSAIYSRILLQIPAERREISSQILRWVCMALRPLQLKELGAAICIQASPLITIEQAVRDQIALCGPFLKVQEQEVTVIHQSARDYLLRKESDSNTALERFRIKSREAHLELARTCLKCVNQSALQHTPLELDYWSCIKESPLLVYAALHWPKHAKSCGPLASALFDPSSPFFKKESTLRMNWRTAYHNATWSGLPSSSELLCMVCFLGVVPWVEALLRKKRWRHRLYKRKKNEDWLTMYWAVLGENEEVGQVLIDCGIDVKARDFFGSTLLHLAATRENKAMVRLLIASGVDIEAKDYCGRTALHLAATSNKDMVQLLIDSGVDIQAKDSCERTALHFAAAVRDQDVVQLLIDNGVDIQVKDSNGWTALHVAAIRNQDAVHLLIGSGVDIEARDNNGWTALHAVAITNRATPKLLINGGADVQAKDNDGWTALHWAVRGGNIAMVQLLLNSGADVRARNSNGKTALHLAASRGNEVLVRLLVDSGADIKEKDNSGKIALQEAAMEGHEAVARFLRTVSYQSNSSVNQSTRLTNSE
jgi:ankyrin repeat protein